MHVLARALVSAVAATLAVSASAGAGMAREYNPPVFADSLNGSWPVTITGSHGFTGCLTITSSSASVVIGSQKYSYGTYFIANNLLVVTIPAAGYGQNAGMVFIGRAGHRKIGDGAYDEVYGGEAFVSGALSFGMKNGC